MARVHVLAWQVGYRGIVPDGFLDALDVDLLGEEWTAKLASRPEVPVATTERAVPIVADLDGVVAGIASYGPYRPVDHQTADEAQAEGLSELWMLNVDPDYWGTGVAQTLIAHAVEALRSGRSEPKAALWVLEDNLRGWRFYEKQGWLPDGRTKTEEIGGKQLVELRYTTSL